MIVLDENIPEDQCELLRGWRIRFRQIGQQFRRAGMKDNEHVLPLLHQSKTPTFITRDLGFYDRNNCHANYCLACFAVAQKEVAEYVRRFLKYPDFDTKTKRLGMVVLVSHEGLRAWQLHGKKEAILDWSK